MVFSRGDWKRPRGAGRKEERKTAKAMIIKHYEAFGGGYRLNDQKQKRSSHDARSIAVESDSTHVAAGRSAIRSLDVVVADSGC
jgi:hypothetical protein